MSSLLLFLLFLCFILLVNNNVSEASRHLNKKLPSAVVVGTVYCDTCFHQHASIISGALVAVECGDSSASKPTFREEVKTDEKGEFKAHLPFSISKHVKKIEGCSVKLIRSSEPYCAVASTATSSTLHLKSKKQGTHIFSAGFFTFKPLNEPQLCNQKPSIKNSRDINSLASLIQNPEDLSFPPPLKDPPEPFLPPLPSLPTLPLTPPGIIGPPLKTTPTSDELSNEKALGFPFPPNPFNPPSLFPPNPFLPPPSVLPPLPFQPPPSLFPPIFPSPPPSLFPPINFPPLPGLIPSPPPPPPSLFPPIFPRLPPFPFQPAPGFPGVPPASSTKKASP